MSPPFATAQISLDYPPYASDFDPKNSDFLLIGGGGGEGRSGVGNKITLINASKRNELSEIVDINLSKEEDSVTTLAIAQSTELWGTAFAGINSSSADQNTGKNEHLRSFLLEYPRRKSTSPETVAPNEKPPVPSGPSKALGKASLFTPSTAATKETYQRVLRLSKRSKDSGPRMGVVATGLAPEGEVVAFAAESSRPSAGDVRARFNLGEKVEAADVDILALELSEKKPKDEFRVAYCTDYDTYLADINYTGNEKAQLDPQCIFGTGHPDTFASSPARPKFRFIRFLTPTLLLVVQNLPKGSGSELLLLEISGIVILRKRLHKKIRNATAFAISAFPLSDDGDEIQHAIAVAGADLSVTVLTLDHPSSSPYGKLSFQRHVFLPTVQPLSITSLSLSTHTNPKTPWSKTPPQYLKLASTSISNTVILHTFPLTAQPLPPPDDIPVFYSLSQSRKTKNKLFSENVFSVFVAIIAIGIAALFLQAFTEIRGGAPEYLGAKGWLPASLHDRIARPYMFEDGVSKAWSRSIESEVQTASSYVSVATEAIASAAPGSGSGTGSSSLRDLLAQRNSGTDTSDETADLDIIIRHSASSSSLDTVPESGVSIEKRPAQQMVEGETVKKWEDLEHHEREGWKRKLIEAGEWTLDEGETILKGVLFSGLAGVVGGAVAG